mmetsp:Transcript_13075/g.24220  ORF Transcript_13075/g.24220 Transcript_13075/m.24220 type:complete len:341 (-) Transcript_13075:76-1098(-)
MWSVARARHLCRYLAAPPSRRIQNKHFSNKVRSTRVARSSFPGLAQAAILGVSAFGGLAVIELFRESDAARMESPSEVEVQESSAPKMAPANLSNPFTYPELTEAIRVREEREKQLLDLRAKARNRVFLLEQRLKRGDINPGQFQMEMYKLKEKLNAEAQPIIFGVSKDLVGAREDYLQNYGCIKWSEDAMKVISELGPIVELGAGNGQWAEELASAWKVDIVAYDNMSHLPVHPDHVPKDHRGNVLEGDETKLKQHEDRALLLVCPPPTNMATQSLKYYKGSTIIFVGEGRGGAHADDAFFNELERNWKVVQVVDVDPFPECYERCFILERRKKWFGWF